MRDKYFQYLDALAARDRTLVILAGLAVAIVIAWLMIDVITPRDWRPTVRSLYIVAGLALYAVTIYLTVGVG